VVSTVDRSRDECILIGSHGAASGSFGQKSAETSQSAGRLQERRPSFLWLETAGHGALRELNYRALRQVLLPANVEAAVVGWRRAGVARHDAVPAAQPALASPCNL